MSAGQLDRRVRLDRAVVTRDQFGGDAREWVPIGTVWASRQDASDAEQMSASQVNAVKISRFVVRSSQMTRSITPQDRVFYDDVDWDIQGVKETRDGRLAFLEITAQRRVDGQA